MDVGFGSMQISLFDKNLLVTTEKSAARCFEDPRHSSGRQYDGGAVTGISSERWWTMSWKTIKRYLKDKKIKHLIGIGENILYLFGMRITGKPLCRVTRERFDEFYARLVTMNETQIEEHSG